MITLHFQAETWPEIDEQMRRAVGVPVPVYTHAKPEFTDFPTEDDPDYAPGPAEAEEEAATKASIAASEAAMTAAKPKRSHKKAAPAPATHEPAPAPEPEPEIEPEDPTRPTIDALKQIVTKAVRAAQKGEGSKKILDLLPDFKAKTKLDFVMNAEDAHYAALNDLIVEAGLVAV